MSADIQYHPRLYLSDGITAGKLDKIKKQLARNPVMARVYVIVLSRNGVDQLDIFESKTLGWPYYRKNPPVVVGIAQSYGEAIQIIEKMAQECLNARGDCALREYLLCQG